MAQAPIILQPPPWLAGRLAGVDGPLHGDEARMRFVVDLARLNVDHGTGGPFGAAVFDAGAGTLLAAGVNCVIPSGCSMAHAEVMAIATAQASLGSHDLSAEGLPRCELVTSTEPCVMCLGAICWSGVRSVVCGARDEDARAIGFDEGPKPPDWAGALAERGIRVVRDVLRTEAAAVLRHYAETGGGIYNAGD